jgi:ketosteroid isomerase-like protein
VSKGNANVVTGLIAALNSRDTEAMVTSYYSPDVEFIPALQAAIEGTIYRGSDEIRAYYDEIYAIMEELRVDLNEICEQGDTLLAAGVVSTRGRGSGVKLQKPWFFVFRLSRSKVVWQRNFADRAEALRVVRRGLPFGLAGNDSDAQH